MSDIQGSQRIDVWMWYARLYKTRTIATKMVRGGKVRLNGIICKKSSTTVNKSDVLTFTRSNDVYVVKILNLGVRRGPASEAQTLYEDLTPPAEAGRKGISQTITSLREKGAGRPTKRDRRAIDNLMNRI